MQYSFKVLNTERYRVGLPILSVTNSASVLNPLGRDVTRCDSEVADQFMSLNAKSSSTMILNHVLVDASSTNDAKILAYITIREDS